MSLNDRTVKNNRRPLKSRDQGWAMRLAVSLHKRGVNPNQISFASLVFAVIGCLLLWLAANIHSTWLPTLYVAAALCCQLRLLCNLMDGMVAMESSEQSPTGPIWNELPDRFSDILFFVGLGLASNHLVLAWAVAALAILLSYIREFGHGQDGVMDYVGPMAKPQRMALLTLALLLASVLALVPALEGSVFTATNVLSLSLWIAMLGCIVTLVRRIIRLVNRVST